VTARALGVEIDVGQRADGALNVGRIDDIQHPVIASRETAHDGAHLPVGRNLPSMQAKELSRRWLPQEMTRQENFVFDVREELAIVGSRSSDHSFSIAI